MCVRKLLRIVLKMFVKCEASSVIIEYIRLFNYLP